MKFCQHASVIWQIPCRGAYASSNISFLRLVNGSSALPYVSTVVFPIANHLFVHYSSTVIISFLISLSIFSIHEVRCCAPHEDMAWTNTFGISSFTRASTRISHQIVHAVKIHSIIVDISHEHALSVQITWHSSRFCAKLLQQMQNIVCLQDLAST